MNTIAIVAALLQDADGSIEIERSASDGRWTLALQGEETLDDRTVVNVVVRKVQDVRDPGAAPAPDARDLSRARRARVTAGRWSSTWEYGDGHLSPGLYEIALSVEGGAADAGWTRVVMLAPEENERGYLFAEIKRLRDAAASLHRLLDGPARQESLSRNEFDRLNAAVRETLDPLRDGAAASPLCRSRQAFEAVVFRTIEHGDGLTEGASPAIRVVQMSMEALVRAEGMIASDALSYSKTLLAEVAERTRDEWRRGRQARWKRWTQAAGGFTEAVRRTADEDAVAAADAVDAYVTACEGELEGSSRESPEPLFDALKTQLPIRDTAD